MDESEVKLELNLNFDGKIFSEMGPSCSHKDLV